MPLSILEHGKGISHCFCVRCMCYVCLSEGIEAAPGRELDGEAWVCNRDCPCEPCHNDPSKGGKEDWDAYEIEAEPED